MKLTTPATFIQSIRCRLGNGAMAWCAGVLSYLSSCLSACTDLYMALLSLRGCSTDADRASRADRSHRLSGLGDLGQLPAHIPSSFGSSGYQWKPFNGGLSSMEQVQMTVSQTAANQIAAIHIIEEQFRQLRSGRDRLRLTPLT